MEDNDKANVRGWKSDPGPQGHWLFTEILGTLDTYLIGSEQWPDCYMYMEDNDKGNVRGFRGDPGLQGHWTVTDIGTVTIDGKTVKTYALATVKCPNWYIYTWMTIKKATSGVGMVTLVLKDISLL